MWSQNLELFKLTEIWYRGRLLYVYFDFNLYFFQFFLSFIFSLVKFGRTKSEVLQIKWNLAQGYIVYAHYDFNVCFFKILYIHILLEQIWSKNVIVIHICLGKFGPKIWSSTNWLKYYILMFIISKF